MTFSTSCCMIVELIRYKGYNMLVRPNDLIDYDIKTGTITRKDNKPFKIYNKDKVPYVNIGGSKVPLLNLLWEYVYGKLPRYTSIYFLTENRTDYRLFNLVCPGNPNFLAANKINRYMNRLARQHEEDLKLAGTFAMFDK